MKEFIKSNAIKSVVANLFINTLIPYLILLSDAVVNVKGAAPNLISVLVPGVFMPAFITTLITFGVMTSKRKSGQLLPVLIAPVNWLPTALLTGVGIGLLFTVPALLLILLVQSLLGDGQIPKLTVILVSAIIGALTGLLASFIAVNRAAKL